MLLSVFPSSSLFVSILISRIWKTPLFFLFFSTLQLIGFFSTYTQKLRFTSMTSGLKNTDFIIYFFTKQPLYKLKKNTIRNPKPNFPSRKRHLLSFLRDFRRWSSSFLCASSSFLMQFPLRSVFFVPWCSGAFFF